MHSILSSLTQFTRSGVPSSDTKASGDGNCQNRQFYPCPCCRAPFTSYWRGMQDIQRASKHIDCARRVKLNSSSDSTLPSRSRSTVRSGFTSNNIRKDYWIFPRFFRMNWVSELRIECTYLDRRKKGSNKENLYHILVNQKIYPGCRKFSNTNVI